VISLPCVAWPPRRIAVFRALYLGDFIVAVPALRAIRAHFPQAEITLIGLPWAATLARRYHRYIDRFVAFPGYPGLIEGTFDQGRLERFLAEQRAYHYDLVVQMHGSGKYSNAFVCELNGKATAGYYEQMCPKGLTIGAPYPHEQHEIFRNLGLAALLGCTKLFPRLEFPLYAEDRAEVDTLLHELAVNKDTLLIGIHPGSRSPARRWPAEYFAAVADELVQQFGAQIVVTGSSNGQAIARAVIDHMKMPAINLAGRTSFGALGALISKLYLFISNDSGPTHIACAVQCPSVTIFGPAEYERWAPLDHSLHPTVRHPVECSPCSYWQCPIDHRCLRRLTPAMVMSVAERLVYETAQNPHVAYSRQLSQHPGTH
jgi:lipopolysaccharide heptosyltransferase II